MVGSKRYFGYTTDDNVVLAVEIDESNGESGALGFSSVPAAVAERPELRVKSSSSFPLELRYILAQRTDSDGRTIRRRFYVGSTDAATIWGPQKATAQISGNQWFVTAKVGEKRHYIPFADTGLIDTDVESNVAAGPALPPG